MITASCESEFDLENEREVANDHNLFDKKP